MTFDYKKYSLENLENWMHDAMSAGEATPQEIYDVIVGVVKENYYIYKHQTSQAYELLALLNGNSSNKYEEYLNKVLCHDEDNKITLKTDGEDRTPKWQQDCMPSCGHSDMEALRYTEEELNAMCDKAESSVKKNWKIVNEDYPYPIHVSEDGDLWIPDAVTKKDKVVKWQLPVQVDGLSGDCFVEFPDDLLEAANLKEGETVEWIDRGDGSFELRKVTKPLGMDEC
jgi:hypothetical protein